MNAIICGSAGVAVLVDGDSLHSIHARDLAVMVPRRQEELNLLIGDAGDLEFVEDVDANFIRHRLRVAADTATALDLVLILLDAQLSKGVRLRAATELADLLTGNVEISQRLQAILFSKPLPTSCNCENARQCCGDRNRVSARFLQELNDVQSMVHRVRVAWEAIPDYLFVSADLRRCCEGLCVRHGVFRELVTAATSGLSIRQRIANCVARLLIAGFSDAQRVLDAWGARLEYSNQEELRPPSRMDLVFARESHFPSSALLRGMAGGVSRAKAFWSRNATDFIRVRYTDTSSIRESLAALIELAAAPSARSDALALRGMQTVIRAAENDTGLSHTVGIWPATATGAKRYIAYDCSAEVSEIRESKAGATTAARVRRTAANNRNWLPGTLNPIH